MQVAESVVSDGSYAVRNDGGFRSPDECVARCFYYRIAVVPAVVIRVAFGYGDLCCGGKFEDLLQICFLQALRNVDAVQIIAKESPCSDRLKAVGKSYLLKRIAALENTSSYADQY